MMSPNTESYEQVNINTSIHVCISRCVFSANSDPLIKCSQTSCHCLVRWYQVYNELVKGDYSVLIWVCSLIMKWTLKKLFYYSDMPRRTVVVVIDLWFDWRSYDHNINILAPIMWGYMNWRASHVSASLAGLSQPITSLHQTLCSCY